MPRIRRAGRGRPVLVTAALAATLALTATACSSGDDSDKKADAKPAASDSAQGDDGKDRLGLPDKLPEDLPTSMKDLEG